MGRGRTGEGVVRADQVAAVLPSDSRRHGARQPAGDPLRRPRFLTPPRPSAEAGLVADARARGLRRRPRRPAGCACPRPRRVSPPSSPTATTAPWTGWQTKAEPPRRPARAWPEARSRRHARPELRPGCATRWRASPQRDRATISVYARHRDYHDLIKGKLKRIAATLRRAMQARDVKVFVDTAPLMEKPLAAAAGLGWQGKHTNLVSREFGSWLFLGAILTDAELPPDDAETDHCGTCRACLDICPTNAFPAPYRLDARRCISYLTIEHEGPDPARVPQGDRQPHLWLRRLPRRLPVEQVRTGDARGEARRPRRSRRPAARRARRASTTPPSAPASPARRSSASAATGSSATFLIAIGNSGEPDLVPVAEAPPRRSVAAGPRRRRLGARRARPGPRRRRARRRARRRNLTGR